MEDEVKDLSKALGDEEELIVKPKEEEPIAPIINPEYINLELPNGLKIILGSSKFDVFILSALANDILKKLSKGNTKKKAGEYLG